MAGFVFIFVFGEETLHLQQLRGARHNDAQLHLPPPPPPLSLPRHFSRVIPFFRSQRKKFGQSDFTSKFGPLTRHSKSEKRGEWGKSAPFSEHKWGEEALCDQILHTLLESSPYRMLLISLAATLQNAPLHSSHPTKYYNYVLWDKYTL